jgi:hypothetical protein
MNGSAPRHNVVLLIVLSLLLVVGSGVVHGLHTDRWGQSDKVLAAGSRLDRIPRVIGDWVSEEVEIPPQQLQQAEAVGHLSRKYVNQVDGREMTILILCGRPGPISVHPPTVCFTGAGWRLASTPKPFAWTAPEGSDIEAEFWSCDFVRSTDEGPMVIRTLWAWSSSDDWLAHERPRLATAHHPYLYKMYVTAPNNPTEIPLDTPFIELDQDPPEALLEFLEIFLPAVNTALSSEHDVG